MSFEAQAWAAKIILKSPSEKAVLNAMANCADEEGRCFPSFGYLERVTAWNRRTCMRAAEALCNMGLLVKSSRHRENGSNQSNEYVLLLAVLEPKTVEDSAEKQGGG